ncbi:MAG: nitroreductase/quinone reductase family protein [Anaerolineales bacterium]
MAGKATRKDLVMYLIQVRSKMITVQAHPAQGEQYQRLWRLVTEQDDSSIKYRQSLQRRIPIVILTPVALL